MQMAPHQAQSYVAPPSNYRCALREQLRSPWTELRGQLRGQLRGKLAIAGRLWDS